MRRTKEEAEKTRLKIIEAALTLFSRNGYSNTTLAMIAVEAGCSRGPIYWHFASKDDLYQAVLSYSQHPLEQLLGEATAQREQPLQAIDSFVTSWLDLLIEDNWFRQSFEILLNKTELTEALSLTLERERQLTRRIIDTLSLLLASARENQLIPATHSPEQLGLLLYTLLMGITQSWLFAPTLFSLRKERDFFVGRMHALLQQR